MVTRCMRSSSVRTLLQVSPLAFSTTQIGSSPSQQSLTRLRIRSSVVEDRPESERSLQVPPTPFDLQELLVGEGEISGRQAVVTGLQQPLAVQLGLSGDGPLSMRKRKRPSCSRRTRRQRAGVVRSRPASSSRRDALHSSVPAIWVSR